MRSLTARPRPTAVHRTWLLEGGLVAALTICACVVLGWQAQRQPFSVDESRWIATSRYFWITFVERDLLGPDWQPNYLVFTHPPVARYVIGFGLWAQGWSPDQLNGRYDTDRSREDNRQAGNVPSRDVLDAARRSVLPFAVGATLLLYAMGRQLGGPIAGACAVAIALANPLLATIWTRALAESVLAFFYLLACCLGPKVARLRDDEGRRFFWPFGLGVAEGLATATKLSGALAGLGLVLFVLIQQAVRWRSERTWTGTGPWSDAGLAAVLTFILVNPLLYPNPALRSLMLFEHRRDEMEQQALETPALAVPPGVMARAGLVVQRTFGDWGTFEARSGLPLDAPLAALGCGALLASTWRSIRTQMPLRAPTLVLCWAVAVFGVTMATIGFDSPHYVAPTETVTVLLEAVALAALAKGGLRLWRQRSASVPSR